MATTVRPTGSTHPTAEPNPRPSIRPAQPVELAAVWATAFGAQMDGAKDGYAGADPDSPDWLAKLAEWHNAGDPVWLELAVPDDPDQWFEGIADPWRSTETPEIDWCRVEPALKTLGVITKGMSDVTPGDNLESRTITILPHLYALGVARVRSELHARDNMGGQKERSLLVFPTVGFHPVEGDGAHGDTCSYWVVRTCVGVIDKVVVSIRLPDLLCTGTPGPDQYRTPVGADLPVPKRFFAGRFPQLSGGPSAENVAEAIAMHHSATARAAAEQAREALRAAERKAGAVVADEDDARTPRPRDALHELERISEVIQQVDRQLSRELRRLADFDKGTHPAARNAEMRYRFALDEIRSIRNEVATGRSAIVGSIQAREQDEREKFQFIVALLGSAILIPTLVAAVYGANVKLPGERDTTGFIGLILFILSFAVLGVLAVNAMWARGWVPREHWRGGWRTRALAIAGVALFALGLVAVY